MTTATETPTTTAWVGWYRLTERSPWRRACTGATLAECSRLLSDATRGARFKRALDASLQPAPPRLPPYPQPQEAHP